MNSLFPATALLNLPVQMKSYVQKIANDKAWAKKTIDAYENIARQQYFANMSLTENYRMLGGEFILSHYMEVDGVRDMVATLGDEVKIPSTLRHFDIINKTVNNLTERLTEFPDIFRVEEQYESDDANEYIRTQTELLQNSVKADINNEINNRLLQQGIDVSKMNFDSEDQAMQYQQELQQMKQAMAPKEIDKWMKTSWNSQGEIWGNHELKISRRRFNLPQVEKLEFRDMLTADRCFRHFYLTPTGYNQETWNPLHTFFVVSDDVQWVQKGSVVGRYLYMSKADIIDRFGWKMTKEQIERMEPEDDDDSTKEVKRDRTGFPYNVYAPFPDYKAYALTKNAFGSVPMNTPGNANPATTNIAFGNSYTFSSNEAGLFSVVEVYWKSQRQIGKVVYIDPETGLLTKKLVDENFIVPKNFTEKSEGFYDSEEINNVYWTWINETWKGVKLNNLYADNDDENAAIYLDVEPCEFQFKSEQNPYECLLPVCGRVFNNRNAQSMSLVDLQKPSQVGYNLCMNQIIELLSSETGSFIVWDQAFFNSIKGWGGDDAAEKVAIAAKELKHVVGNASQSGTNTLPKTVVLEFTSQLLSRAKLAEFFENRAIGQLGISPQIMANTDPNETAAGVNTAVGQGMLNIQRYYSDFFEYKRQCLSMNLDIAQFTQSTNKDTTIMYTKSDMSREFIRLLGLNLLLKDLHAYVTNSQELAKQIEAIKQYFINTNTTTASELDIFKVMTENSPAAIRAQLELSQDKKDQLVQQQMKLQQDTIGQKQQNFEELQNREDARDNAKNQTTVQVADIMASKAKQTPTPIQQPNFSNQNLQENNNRSNDQAIKRDTNRIHEKNIDNSTRLKKKELDIKNKALNIKNKQDQTNLKIAKVNKNKYSVKKS